MQDRTVVITGAAAGIGAALARRYASDGARLVLLDRDRAGVEAVADALEAGGVTTTAIACDVTSPTECEAAMEAAVRIHGGIDVLVNNAGITHIGRFRDTDLEVLRRVMEINYFGAVYATKAALPSLLQRRGQVVTITSMAGVGPLALRSGYAGSKHALHGLFDSIRAEHRRDGLRVLIVCPSFVDTDIGDHALGPDGRTGTAGARTGVRTPADPDDVADAIVRAASRGRRLLVVPRRAWFHYLVARLLPAVYARAMERRTLPPSTR